MDNRDKYQNYIVSGRAVLLMMIILTVINTVMNAAQSNYYFLFSARIPEYTAGLGISLFRHGDRSATLLVITLAIAVFIILLYLMCYFLFLKHTAFIITAASLFFADTVLFITLLIISGDFRGDITLFIDIAFHLGVLYILIKSCYGAIALKKLSCANVSDNTPDSEARKTEC